MKSYLPNKRAGFVAILSIIVSLSRSSKTIVFSMENGSVGGNYYPRLYGETRGSNGDVVKILHHPDNERTHDEIPWKQFLLTEINPSKRKLSKNNKSRKRNVKKSTKKSKRPKNQSPGKGKGNGKGDGKGNVFRRTKHPTQQPIPPRAPTQNPTTEPTTKAQPISQEPSDKKRTLPPQTMPQQAPTQSPTIKPTMVQPSMQPQPMPQQSPTQNPTIKPTMAQPSMQPQPMPQQAPTQNPTTEPTMAQPSVPATSLNISETLQDNGFMVLNDLFNRSSLLDELSDPRSNLTLFGPTDEAFRVAYNKNPYLFRCLFIRYATTILPEILLYHVTNGLIYSKDFFDGQELQSLMGDELEITVNGNDVSINGKSAVDRANLMASNGIIHGIDRVLFPPSLVDKIAESCGQDSNIPKTLEENGFTVLHDLLKRASLLDELSDPFTSLTMFAPTNEAFYDAFEESDSSTYQCLILPRYITTTFADILLYHVANGELNSTDFSRVNGQKIQTVQGGEIEILFDGEGALINGISAVNSTSILAPNGVIYGIDHVLSPPSFDAKGFVEVCYETDLPNELISPDSDLDYDIFYRTLNATGLIERLSAPIGQYTLFAPIDVAFNKLPDGLFQGCLTFQQASEILLCHVVDGQEIFSEEMKNGQAIQTMGGCVLTVEISNGKYRIDGVNVIATDDEASNGIRHSIDTLLIPSSMNVDAIMETCRRRRFQIIPEILEEDGFTVLYDLLSKALLLDSLSNTLSNLTLFAPTNEAFEMTFTKDLDPLVYPCLILPRYTTTVLADVLLYHVTNGLINSTGFFDGQLIETLSLLGSTIDIVVDTDGVFLNGYSAVDRTDLLASNGIIHSIDRVLFPKQFAMKRFVEGCINTDIPKRLISPDSPDNNYNILYSLLNSIGLVEQLSAPKGPYTLLAPTDEAFRASNLSPDGLLYCLTLEEITQILQYHVINGYEKSLVNEQAIQTLSGDVVRVEISDGGSKINNANVISTDDGASNGIRYTIDAVLIPSSVNIIEIFDRCKP